MTALGESFPGSPDWIEARPSEDGLAAFRDLDNARTAAANVVVTPD